MSPTPQETIQLLFYHEI